MFINNNQTCKINLRDSLNRDSPGQDVKRYPSGVRLDN